MEIVDPPVAKQQPEFSVPPLLGYLENVADTSWMIVDDILTGKIALLCDYIAVGFPAGEDSRSFYERAIHPDHAAYEMIDRHDRKALQSRA